MVEVAVLEEVAEIFASLRDVDAALARFLTLARTIAGSSFGAIYLRDDGRGEFLRWREDAATPLLHLPIPLVEQFFAGVDHRLVSLDDGMFAGVPAIAVARQAGLHATLGLPMRSGDRLVGVLGLAFSSVAAVPAELRTLAALARFPAAAIEHAHTQELVARRARLADALRRFGERALGTLDIAALHRLILDTTVELTGSDQASITEVHGELVRVVAGVGKDEPLVGTSAPAEALLETLATDEPYVVCDVAAADGSKLLIKLARKTGAGSFMALPMRHQSRVFGHLFAGAAAPHRYPEETVEAMRILASMAAAVLEQRSAYADAARHASRLAATIESLPLFIEVFGADGALLLANGMARATRARVATPVPTAQCVTAGLTVTQLDGTPIAADELPPARALRGIHPPRREVIVYRGSERLATVSMGAAPIFAPDGTTVEAVVFASQDVSTLHQVAQEKERFLRVAAHELRTPLTALHATTQLVDVDPDAFADDARRAPVLARIRRQTERLVRLVEQLLDSVRVQTGELPLAPAAVDLVALCRDVVDTALPAGGPRAVVRADRDAVVGRWDRVRIEQVVTNLLSNAIRYSAPDGEIEVGVRVDGGRALVSVRDAGIGIPEHQLALLFTPFFRAANAQRSQSGGLGLGLHIAQEIVRRHGGAIRVESRENAGTTFTVELPIERV